MSVTLNAAVPDLQLHVTGDRQVPLSSYQGKHLILYFYPKASTPGCTQEGLDFKAAFAKLRRLSTTILGVSRDSLKTQETFKKKQAFPFDLVSDKDEALCAGFNVIKLKNMYGKQVRGIERSTLLIDPLGVLRREWRGVKVKGHVEEVLAAVKVLKQGER